MRIYMYCCGKGSACASTLRSALQQRAKMKVFVTGAPGFIGSAVVADLLANNHTVVGLARSDASAEKVKAMGAEVHRGDIEDLDSLRSGAKACDRVIHLAFVHDFTDFERCCKIDREAITAMAEAMEGTNKPLVMASGVLHLPHGITSTEETDAKKQQCIWSLHTWTTICLDYSRTRQYGSQSP